MPSSESCSPENARDFHHPFQPYAIQVDFMNALYDTINDGKIGIFESPTGTGKSLSLICGAMTWLRDHQRLELESATGDDGEDSSEPAWVREYQQHILRDNRLRKFKRLEDRLRRVRESEARDQAAIGKTRIFTGDSRSSGRKRSKENESSDENQFLVKDWTDDSDASQAAASTGESNLSSEVQALLHRLNPNTNHDDSDDDNDEFDGETKIFYASRTHSQLTQFVEQLKLPHFPPSELYSGNGELHHVPLSSRKQLCIHPTISRLRNVTDINDRCAELQHNSGDKRCPYMMNEHEAEGRNKTREFRDRILAHIHDIEDLADIGKSMDVCSYYASRSAVKSTEIVTLPYPLLLQSSNRRALSLSLKNHVVIIDEAHNLIDAISSLFSQSISLSDVERSSQALEAYLKKFSNKLNVGNKAYITQICKLLTVLKNFLQNFSGSNGTEIVQNDILQNKSIDTINLHKIETYLEKSKLAWKLESYVGHLTNLADIAARKENSKNRPVQRQFSSVPTLSKVMAFIMTLSNLSDEGKIFFEQTTCEKYLKYLLLDVSFHFRSVVEDARCVILAGGTMEPISDYKKYLFPYVPDNKIRILSSDHVIPPQNLAAWTIMSGPSGKELKFSFDQQGLESSAKELGRTISNLCYVIPDGMVVFFPSYKYMEQVCISWQKQQPNSLVSLWDQINKRKAIFQEPREATEVDGVLSEYAQMLSSRTTGTSTTGAILLAVVGGKMSEGINFSDQLARGIIMVGLPFPNARSADMIAKRRYVEDMTSSEVKRRELLKLKDQYTTESDIPAPLMARIRDICKKEADQASQDYYENVCMRAVNQSIGRGIRHANDYAVILFADCRYASERIHRKLPKWIRSRMGSGSDSAGNIGSILKQARKFFASK
ncbi:helicase C-terminal domain-containing protein [Limtongia smithiae]|uniref:helicase C-terminal domain-containing protein n=1 Tax=Limtongia smithiae TaxID=1125753 RepID=UPI0034CEC09B